MTEIDALSARIRACADKYGVWVDVEHKAHTRRYERELMRIEPLPHLEAEFEAWLMSKTPSHSHSRL